MPGRKKSVTRRIRIPNRQAPSWPIVTEVTTFVAPWVFSLVSPKGSLAVETRRSRKRIHYSEIFKTPLVPFGSSSHELPKNSPKSKYRQNLRQPRPSGRHADIVSVIVSCRPENRNLGAVHVQRSFRLPYVG